jgi:hypothetical protein
MHTLPAALCPAEDDTPLFHSEHVIDHVIGFRR